MNTGYKITMKNSTAYILATNKWKLKILNMPFKTASKYKLIRDIAEKWL